MENFFKGILTILSAAAIGALVFLAASISTDIGYLVTIGISISTGDPILPMVLALYLGAIIVGGFAFIYEMKKYFKQRKHEKLLAAGDPDAMEKEEAAVSDYRVKNPTIQKIKNIKVNEVRVNNEKFL
jgi:beta-lactamase regulating signal transducer with metallopeptidase domain